MFENYFYNLINRFGNEILSRFVFNKIFTEGTREKDQQWIGLSN